MYMYFIYFIMYICFTIYNIFFYNIIIQLCTNTFEYNCKIVQKYTIYFTICILFILFYILCIYKYIQYNVSYDIYFTTYVYMINFIDYHCAVLKMEDWSKPWKTTFSQKRSLRTTFELPWQQGHRVSPALFSSRGTIESQGGVRNWKSLGCGSQIV